MEINKIIKKINRFLGEKPTKSSSLEVIDELLEELAEKITKLEKKLDKEDKKSKKKSLKLEIRIAKAECRKARQRRKELKKK